MMMVLLMTVFQSQELWVERMSAPNLLLQCSEATPDMDLAIATDLAKGGYLPVR
jgi:hypothetical protein